MMISSLLTVGKNSFLPQAKDGRRKERGRRLTAEMMEEYLGIQTKRELVNESEFDSKQQENEGEDEEVKRN